jgi:excisionase family DNA binding protein
MQQHLWTVPEASEFLRRSRSLTYTYIRSGRLRTVHLGRLVRIPSDSHDEFVEWPRAEEEGESQGRSEVPSE